jgi:dTMP kinase
VSAGGCFVTFEGVEGVGKSTQIDLLADALASGGIQVVCTREPGGTSLGRSLRGLLLDTAAPAPLPQAELLLYVADRAQHVGEVIEPALGAAKVVLCDRYIDATIAYQGHARGLGADCVRELHVAAGIERSPDRTLLLDLPVEEALARARGRDRQSGRAADEGRFEAEALEFHSRVRDGYAELAERDPDRIVVVDAAGPIRTVQARVRRAVQDLWPLLEAAT